MTQNRRAFTLAELLTVIAIIGLLAALLFPSIATARAAASRTRTKVLFNQWASAVEAFRAEYGCYPQFGSSSLVNDGALASPDGEHLFHDLLSGRHRDGSPLALAAPAAGQNFRLIRFYSFAASEFSAGGLLQDGFGNTEVVVLVDADLDGVIKAGADFATLPTVHAPDGEVIVPSAADFPVSGVAAGVVFYSADPRATGGNPLFIFSWK